MSGGAATIKAHVKTVDMSEEMEKFAIDTATEALMTCMKEKEMAAKVRRRFARLCCSPHVSPACDLPTLRSPVHPPNTSLVRGLRFRSRLSLTKRTTPHGT